MALSYPCGGVYTLLQIEIPVRSLSEPIWIIPIGDVHYAADEHCAESFLRTCKNYAEWVKEGRNVWFLWMGDYLDMLRYTERKAIRALELEGPERAVSKLARQYIYEFGDLVTFAVGRSLVVIEGNHGAYISTDAGLVTDTEELCGMLNAPYGGCHSDMRIVFNYNGSKRAVDVTARHAAGRPGGSTEGAAINRRAKFKDHQRCDIFLAGDDHALFYKECGVIRDKRFNNKSAQLESIEIPQAIVGTGGFTKFYVPGKANYGVSAGLRGLPIGNVELEFTVSRPLVDGSRPMHIDFTGKTRPRGGHRVVGVAQ